ncbi:hypothetical protein QQ045_003323 [Rhodiola kirilowii]
MSSSGNCSCGSSCSCDSCNCSMYPNISETATMGTRSIVTGTPMEGLRWDSQRKTAVASADQAALVTPATADFSSSHRSHPNAMNK